MQTPELFIGIDVAKAHLAGAARPGGLTYAPGGAGTPRWQPPEPSFAP
jgi:hypothetical protein